MRKVHYRTPQTLSGISTATVSTAVPCARIEVLSYQVQLTLGTATSATFQIQQSNDGTNWWSYGNVVSETSNGTYGLEVNPITGLYVSVLITPVGGSLTAILTPNGTGSA